MRYAALTMLVTLFGLAFYEKTLLIFFAIVALGYFAEGDLVARVGTMWRGYVRYGAATASGSCSTDWLPWATRRSARRGD